MKLHVIDTSVILYNILGSLGALTTCGRVNIAFDDFADAVTLCVQSIDFLMDEGDRVIWVGDSSPYFRNVMFPEYKQGRPPKPDAFHDIARVVFGLKDVWMARRAEADDLVALVCQTHKGPKRIWTVDGDLMQLIDSSTEWFNCGPWEPRLRTQANWQEWFIKRKIAKKYWQNAKNAHDAICLWKYTLGDKSDNYPRHQPIEMYDLLRSPVFGWFTEQQILDKIADAYEVNVSDGAKAYEQLESMGFKPPVIALDKTGSFGWD